MSRGCGCCRYEHVWAHMRGGLPRAEAAGVAAPLSLPFITRAEHHLCPLMEVFLSPVCDGDL